MIVYVFVLLWVLQMVSFSWIGGYYGNSNHLMSNWHCQERSAVTVFLPNIEWKLSEFEVEIQDTVWNRWERKAKMELKSMEMVRSDVVALSEMKWRYGWFLIVGSKYNADHRPCWPRSSNNQINGNHCLIHLKFTMFIKNCSITLAVVKMWKKTGNLSLSQFQLTTHLHFYCLLSKRN